MKSERTYSFLEAKEKIEAWCAYQDRCHFDVERKLITFGLDQEDRAVLTSHLIEYGFLDEQRFADAFVSGKVRIKRWGRIKIKQHLKQKCISDQCISEAMNKIDDEEYRSNLALLLSKKWLTTKGSEYIRKQKVAQFLYGKGYESELIQEQLRDYS